MSPVGHGVAFCLGNKIVEVLLGGDRVVVALLFVPELLPYPDDRRDNGEQLGQGPKDAVPVDLG